METNQSSSSPQEIPQQTDTPAPSKQGRFKNRFTRTIIFIVLGISVLFAAKVFYDIYSTLRYPCCVVLDETSFIKLSPTPTPDPTENWKTYTNMKYLFSFKYPNQLSLQEKQLADYYSVSLASEFKPPFSDYLDILLQVYTVNETTDLKTWLNQYVLQDLPTGKKGSIVSGTINPYINHDLNGYSFVGGVESINKYIFFKKDAYIFGFILRGAETGSSYTDNKNAESTLDQILSTFKFIP